MNIQKISFILSFTTLSLTLGSDLLFTIWHIIERYRFSDNFLDFYRVIVEFDINYYILSIISIVGIIFMLYGLMHRYRWAWIYTIFHTIISGYMGVILLITGMQIIGGPLLCLNSVNLFLLLTKKVRSVYTNRSQSWNISHLAVIISIIWYSFLLLYLTLLINNPI
jgi:hypothetical protein